MTKLQTLPAASGTSAGKGGKSGKSPRRRESPGSLAFSRSARIKGLVKHAILIIVGAVMIYPLLWMVVSSLRPNDLIFREPGLWLESLEMSNYTDGWSALTHPFGHYMVNSAIVVLGSILGNLISCSMAAYAFARLQFSGKKLFFGIMLLTIMLPFHVVIVPQYILFSQIGWVNTFWPLIVPKLLATDAFFVFLMVQFIRGIPKDLDEAARIDGAGHPRIFLRVILPLMVPALATTTIFTFIWTWNDFFGALIYLTDPDMFTVPVALRAFVDSQSATSWGSLFAMSIVSLLPVFLVFLFGQRFLIKGIATTGIK
ncbi:carbohydrate ABC transporter permease [Paenarthrobacter aurescens]|jgi:multiple sugar transport system permease protein|uniref:ABC-type sugar transport system, permease component n=1 Tax=Paenarthrobacter aurescens (strain TC1) TaxID=290340 RepID=A1R9U6_PAEAT|nr:carbohydrate ABC transporter permease [Paenarthrobacter aurescens]ABM09142.1 putative ABC-type sugar transport system, permease component [Paenarthrobacter aurescens TC1]